MNDLLDNFAHQSIASPTGTEEDYKYHFVDGSPAGSDHERHIHPTATASTGPSNDDPFFHNEASRVQGGNDSAVEDEANYNADVDDDYEDDEDEHGRHEDFHNEAYRENPNPVASYNQKSFLEDNADDLYPSIHSEDCDVSKRATYGHVDQTLNSSDDGHDGLKGFARHLSRLHRQDMERDDLLTRLHQENSDLKRVLKESVPGGNPRAEAAERSLFEIRKTLDKAPYACVLVDAKGYKIREDLLQSGKIGGAEAAGRLWTGVSNHLQSFGDSKSWKVLAYLYIDIEGLLARCISNDIPLSDSNVRDFMIGFTQARPLFTIMNVGNDPEKLLRKMEEGAIDLFVNNVQCKHVILGCSHDVAYAVAIERYASNPITAASITLIKSYEDNVYFGGLPFNFVELPQIFRSTPYKETDRLAEDVDYRQNSSSPNHISREVEISGASKVSEGDRALAELQAATNASIPLTAHARPQPKIHLGWATEQNVLLNINDERVDPEPEEVAYETSESMLDRMEVQRFCVYYHLQHSCATMSLGKPCKFRHGPRLNHDEVRFLKQDVRKMPCTFGSKCRKADCLFGHVCANQPSCKKGRSCPLYWFHEVDKTAVRVWRLNSRRVDGRA